MGLSDDPQRLRDLLALNRGQLEDHEVENQANAHMKAIEDPAFYDRQHQDAFRADPKPPAEPPPPDPTIGDALAAGANMSQHDTPQTAHWPESILTSQDLEGKIKRAGVDSPPSPAPPPTAKASGPRATVARAVLGAKPDTNGADPIDPDNYSLGVDPPKLDPDVMAYMAEKFPGRVHGGPMADNRAAVTRAQSSEPSTPSIDPLDLAMAKDAGLNAINAMDHIAPSHPNVQGYQARKAETEAREAEDPTSPTSRRLQSVYAGLMPELAKKLDLSKVPASQLTHLDKLMEFSQKQQGLDQGRQDKMSQFSEGQANRLQMAADSNQTRRDIAGMAHAGRDDVKREKMQQDEDSLKVDGFDFAQGRRPSKDDAKAMKAMMEAKENLKGNFDKLSAMYEAGGGNRNPFGADWGNAKNTRLEAVLEMNKLARLMRINGFEAKSFTDMIPDLNSTMANLGPGAARAQLKQLLGMLETKMASAAKAHNYQAASLSGEGQRDTDDPVVESKQRKDGSTLLKHKSGRLEVR